MAYVVPRASVLDKYQDNTERKIADSATIEELEAQYQEARKKVQESEEGKSEKEKDQLRWDKFHQSEEKLRQAIQAWESRSREIGELHFFWWCGLLCLLLGLICFARGSKWFAVALMTIGFVEMIYWTSPTFRVFGGGTEFERLLIWKLVYTSVSLIVLLGAWGIVARQVRHLNVAT